jgi:CheY-like chemotaxis protein
VALAAAGVFRLAAALRSTAVSVVAPASPSQTFSNLAGALIIPVPPSPAPRTESTMTSQKNRILIADDNQANVELLEAFLAEMDCETEIAMDGQETLDKVNSFKPDLILLDVMMPKQSGFEVCKQIKSDAATKGIMILMVTALNELGDIERAVNAGTDDFLSKPVNKVELVKRVENMLRFKDVADEVERLRRYIERMEEPSEDTPEDPQTPEE